MIIGVFSDLHLGLRQYSLKERENDFYTQYNVAIETFIERGVDLVIIAGDIFDQPRPAPEALKVFTNGLKALAEKDIMVLGVVGNHTMVNAKNFVTADEFVRNVLYENYMLLDEIFSYSTEDVGFYGLPFYYDHSMKDLIEVINGKNKAAGKNNCNVNILVLHQAFKEFCGFTGAELSIKNVDVSNFDLVICGHIHERKLKEIDNSTVFLQPGSLERLNVSEARDEEVNGKGVYIIDTDEMDVMSIAESFVRLPSPRKFMIADFYVNGDGDIEDIEGEILEEVKDFEVPPLLFLTVHDKTNSFHKIMDMSSDLKNAFLTVHFNYFDESDEAVNIIIDKNDIPSPREALKLALNPLDEDQAILGMELYDMLVAGEDPTSMLEEYRLKCQKEFDDSINNFYDEKEFEEIEEWLNQK